MLRQDEGARTRRLCIRTYQVLTTSCGHLASSDTGAMAKNAANEDKWEDIGCIEWACHLFQITLQFSVGVITYT